jgi:hypothetical protein
MNRYEATTMAKDLPFRTHYQYVIFLGGHQWAPKEVVEQGFDWLENWTYFGAPPSPAGKPLYLRYFNQLVQEADAAKTDFGRYVLLDRAQTLANSHALAREKSVLDQITSNRSKLADLAKDPKIKKEVAARDAFNKVYDGEQLIRRKSANNAAQLKSQLAEASKAFRAIADQSPDTVYGAKAKSAVTRLENEPPPAEPPKASH